MFNEFHRLEQLLVQSNERLTSLESNGSASKQEAFYRRRAKDQFRRVQLYAAAGEMVQPELALTAFYLLLADHSG